MKNDEITSIQIDGKRVGLIGLTAIFETIKSLNLVDESAIKRTLIEKVALQNYVPDSKIAEYSQAIYRNYRKWLGGSDSITESLQESTHPLIQILGPGCPACDKLENDIKSILAEQNLAAAVEHVRDLNGISQFGFILTPALAINKQVVLNGRVPSGEKLKKIILEKLEERKNGE